jgi:hypothetical protein
MGGLRPRCRVPSYRSELTGFSVGTEKLPLRQELEGM